MTPEEIEKVQKLKLRYDEQRVLKEAYASLLASLMRGLDMCRNSEAFNDDLSGLLTLQLEHQKENLDLIRDTAREYGSERFSHPESLLQTYEALNWNTE